MTLPLDHCGPVLKEEANGTAKFLKYPLWISGRPQQGIPPTPYGDFTPGKVYEFEGLVLGNEYLEHCASIVDDSGVPWVVVFYDDCWKIVSIK